MMNRVRCSRIALLRQHASGASFDGPDCAIIYEENLGVCVDRKCVLSVSIEPFEQRAEALKKLHAVFLVMRDSGKLRPLSLGHLVCALCTEDMQESCATWCLVCWE